MSKRTGPVRVKSSADVIARLHRKRSELTRLKIKSLTLFGSFARNEVKIKSDVDMIVEFTEPVGFFHFCDVKTSLEAILGRRVDLVMSDALRPEFRDQVEREKIRAA